MARPKGAKSDPIGSIIVRAERDLRMAADRINAALKEAQSLKRKLVVLRRMGL